MVNKSTSEVQSILFDIKKYNAKQSREWLKKHPQYKPIKRVHKTVDKLRYRIQEPSQFVRFRTKKLGDGIELILGFKESNKKQKKQLLTPQQIKETIV